MQIVIPMAGLGKRFSDAGYSLPKPLIPVNGLPMVVRVVRNLPPAEKVVFIAHPEHASRYPLTDLLREHVPGAVVVVAPKLTDGQACSVRLAGDHLHRGQPVLVAACDNTQTYNADAWQRLTNTPEFEAAVWVYRGEPRVLIKPEWYGWVRQEAGKVIGISVKKPISANPMNDSVVSGTFWFRQAGCMLDAIDRLVTSGKRVNNEFYMDSVPDIMIEDGFSVAAFEMDKYIGWGTPDDFEDYLRWERHFSANRASAA